MLNLASASANAMINAVTARLNGTNPGTLTIYDGARPDTADLIVSGPNVLATLTFQAKAFANAANKSAALNALTPVAATGTGRATWFRASSAAGSTVFDGTIGNDSSSDLMLNTLDIVTGGTVYVTSGTISLP